MGIEFGPRDTDSTVREPSTLNFVWEGGIPLVSAQPKQENPANPPTHVMQYENGQCFAIHYVDGTPVINYEIAARPCDLDRLLDNAVNTGAQPVLASQESVATAVPTPLPTNPPIVINAQPAVASEGFQIGGNNPSERGYGTEAGNSDIGVFVGLLVVGGAAAYFLPKAVDFAGSAGRGIGNTIGFFMDVFSGRKQ